MKLTYLGTAAAEGFPALFCNCEYCNEAKRLGGKNIRTRSQALINQDLLIDFPADTYAHFLNNGIKGDMIEHLIVTHAHSDHFYLDDLFMRSGAFAHNMSAPTLNIFCPKTVFEQFTNIPQGTAVTVLEPYRTYEIGAYHVPPCLHGICLDPRRLSISFKGIKRCSTPTTRDISTRRSSTT